MRIRNLYKVEPQEAAAFLAAVENLKLETVGKQLQKNPKLARGVPEALEKACKLNSLAMASLLLTKGAPIADIDNLMALSTANRKRTRHSTKINENAELRELLNQFVEKNSLEYLKQQEANIQLDTKYYGHIKKLKTEAKENLKVQTSPDENSDEIPSPLEVSQEVLSSSSSNPESPAAKKVALVAEESSNLIPPNTHSPNPYSYWTANDYMQNLKNQATEQEWQEFSATVKVGVETGLFELN